MTSGVGAARWRGRPSAPGNRPSPGMQEKIQAFRFLLRPEVSWELSPPVEEGQQSPRAALLQQLPVVLVCGLVPQLRMIVASHSLIRGAQCCGPGSRFAHLRDALQGGAHEHTEGHPHDAR